MKKATTAAFIIMTVLALAGLALAAHHEASADKGKALFNDPKLGTTGKSCNDCHKDGKGAEKASNRKDLDAVVNRCITQALQGKALDARSQEMQSLILYIKTLRGPAVGC